MRQIIPDNLVLDDRELSSLAFSPVCALCRHYISGKKCAAFDSIPSAIWEGSNDHRTPFVGDRGIVFEPYE